jgi:hypothetical protein
MSGTKPDEYLSIYHREWRQHEIAFISTGLSKLQLSRANRRKRFVTDLLAVTRLLRRAWGNDESTVDDVILRAIRRVGFEAIARTDRRDAWEPWLLPPNIEEHVFELLDELRKKARVRIEHWYRLARLGRTLEDRRRGAVHLKGLASALIGQQKGVRSTLDDDVFIVRSYRSFLFRLERATRLLRAWPWGGPKNKRIDDVESACGLPRGSFREFLKVDDAGQPTIRPVSETEFARIWTSKICGGMKQHTLENILAGRERSRK